jgi:hypothetical protein
MSLLNINELKTYLRCRILAELNVHTYTIEILGLEGESTN